MLTRYSLFLCAAFAGCVRGENIVLPGDPTGDAKTVLYLAFSRDHPSNGFARAYRSEETIDVPLSFGPNTELFALYYAESIDFLQLDGELRVTNDASQGRLLPGTAGAILSASFVAGHLVEWTVAPKDALSKVYLSPRLDYARFAEIGACVGAEDEILATCPEAQVTLPAPAVRRCPAGWVKKDEPPFDPCVPAAPVLIPRPQGSVCPADGWPALLPGEAPFDIFVDAEATIGGDGSFSAPYHSIQVAVSNAAAGERIAVAPGNYLDPFDISTAGVQVIGACAAETAIDIQGPITLQAPNILLRDFTFKNTDIRLTAATATISDSLFEPTPMRLSGIIAGPGGVVHVERVLIRGRKDYAVHVVDGGQARVFDSWFEDNIDGAFVCSLGSLAVDRVQVHAGGYYSLSAHLCDVEIRRSNFIDSSPRAIGANEGTFLMEDSIVDTVSAVRDANYGFGIDVYMNREAHVRRVLVTRTQHSGVRISGSRRASIEDVTVLETERNGSPIDTGAVVIADSEDASVERVFSDSGYSRLLILADSAVVRVSDFVGRSNSGGAGGIYIANVGLTTLSRAELYDTGQQALFVSPTSTASITDVTIVRAFHGIKLDSMSGSGSCTFLARASIESSGLQGVLIDSGATAELSDISIFSSGQYPNSASLHVRTQNHLNIERFLLDGGDQRIAGIFVESGFENNLTFPCPLVREGYSLSRGVVRDHLVGARDHREVSDPLGLLRLIRYENNQTTLETN
jgi:hypothetical protein